MRMMPIVDGLKEQYGEQVDFRALDADQEEGLAAVHAYGLRGHPSYVILMPDGRVVWRGLGQLPRATLEANLRQALGEPPS